MVHQRYWASALMAVTTIGLVGTVVSLLTSSVIAEQQHETAQYAQHRGSGRLAQLTLGNAKVRSTQVEQHQVYADSHRGSGRLTAREIAPTSILAWRGSGRISAEGATGLV
ncbi:MAG: hypothetical protein ACFB0C_13600 [Leptolyngbyaceae cyanobacterium]